MSSPVDASGGRLLAQLQGDQAAARREQQKDRVMLLGMIVSEVRNREIELRRGATDDDVIDVIRKGIKKRRESVELYARAGRTDLRDKEQQEVTLLEVYLPAQVDPAEIRAAVQQAIAAGAANVGAVMARVMPAFKGRVDGSVINAVVREELARS
ncbi:GatB/YqeY domain-containing protein [Gemmatimonas sp.]|uniref:GatB/YqeY domain-containing protein n=1 Tax=Gemmatimonas sp. TaxID=1962908 RepID=UPI0022C07FD4|nr:GatB/YqeY domain-containing protein [Gemmatimonas sp.]MCZ8205644.1 GatB/YqeY domain-containing protein [Gemmatimonas sp.]